MMRFGAKEARLKLSAAVYARESLEAAAAAAGEGTAVYLSRKGAFFEVLLRRPSPMKRPALERLAGEFLNEALSHRYRQKVVRFNSAVTQPVLAEVFRAGFPVVPPDPLERLEPQIKEARLKDTADILAKAASL